MSGPPCPAAFARIPAGPGFEARALARLGPEEAAYPARIRHERRRREWLAGRMLAKLLLAGAAMPDPAVEDWEGPAAPGPWQVLPGADGAPLARREGLAAPLSLSLSHAGGWVLAALARDGMVGVDVETVSDVPAAAITRSDPRAAAWLDRGDPEARGLLATLLWTLREAVLKTGVLGPPAVSLVPAAPVLPACEADEALAALRRVGSWTGLSLAQGPPGPVTAWIRRVDAGAVASLVLRPAPLSPTA